jgi:hypothetical protein
MLSNGFRGSNPGPSTQSAGGSHTEQLTTIQEGSGVTFKLGTTLGYR